MSEHFVLGYASGYHSLRHEHKPSSDNEIKVICGDAAAAFAIQSAHSIVALMRDWKTIGVWRVMCDV